MGGPDALVKGRFTISGFESVLEVGRVRTGFFGSIFRAGEQGFEFNQSDDYATHAPGYRLGWHMSGEFSSPNVGGGGGRWEVLPTDRPWPPLCTVGFDFSMERVQRIR